MFLRDWLRVLAVGTVAPLCGPIRASAQGDDGGWLGADESQEESGDNRSPALPGPADPERSNDGSVDLEVPPPPAQHSAEHLDQTPDDPPAVRVFEPEELRDADQKSDATPTEANPSEGDESGTTSVPYSGPPTLLGRNGPIAYGGYAGVDLRGSRVAGHDALLVGGEGALLIDHRLAIGVAGYGLANLIRGPRASDGAPSYLGLGYGGVVVHHNFVNERLVYLSIGTLVGAGGIGFVKEVAEYEYELDESEFDADPFFVVEPSLGLHLNVTRWMRAGASVSYRFTKGIDCEGFTDREFRGPAAGGHVQFGWF